MRILAFTLAIQLGAMICGYGYEPRFFAAETAMRAGLKSPLEMFEIDCDRYPTTSEGLAALVVRPGTISQTSWHGPYLDRLPLDPWGRVYVYISPGTHNTNSYDLYSPGEDGVSGSNGSDPDDLNNWDESREPGDLTILTTIAWNEPCSSFMKSLP